MHIDRDIEIAHDYLCFELSAVNGSPISVELLVEGEQAWEMPELYLDAPRWVSWEVTRLRGKTGRLIINDAAAEDGTKSFDFIQADEPRGPVMVFDQLYHETYRPQFHFTPARNWMNDPNGLVYYKGEYHLFFQHNPSGRQWGNMTWGHAVSRDLVHWTQLDNAIHPDELGTIHSGSAVVDWQDTADLQVGNGQALVAFYTSAGDYATPKQPYTQSLAYSNDCGRTWTKYAHNPVIEQISEGNRDPKVIWYEPGHKWVMALYLVDNDFGLFESEDLKHWIPIQRLTMSGVSECPDFFELSVDDDADNTRWVLWSGDGKYQLGGFDGHTFTPETDLLPSEWGANCYAGQTWSDVPASDNRRIFIGWMRGGRYPGMPFNQQMSFPRVMTLRTTEQGVRLFMMPVKEIELLHDRPRAWRNMMLAPGDNLLADFAGDLVDIDLRLKMEAAQRVELDLRGQTLSYDAEARELSLMGHAASLAPEEDGCIALRVLVDRTSIEVFANNGRVVMSFCFVPPVWNVSYALQVIDGEAMIKHLTLWPVRST